MADEPTIGEVFRVMTDVKQDVRSVRLEMLRADVYSANRIGDDARIRSLELDMEEFRKARDSTRRLMIGAVFTGGVSLLVQAIVAIVSHH